MQKWSHFDLNIWKESHALTIKVYDLTRAFPPDERYALTAQMRRAAHSVSATIIEGTGRQTTKDFANFLFMARGSAHEMMCHIRLAKDVGYMNADEAERLIGRYRGLSAGIFACITSLHKKSAR